MRPSQKAAAHANCEIRIHHEYKYKLSLRTGNRKATLAIRFCLCLIRRRFNWTCPHTEYRHPTLTPASIINRRKDQKQQHQAEIRLLLPLFINSTTPRTTKSTQRALQLANRAREKIALHQWIRQWNHLRKPATKKIATLKKVRDPESNRQQKG